MASFRRDNLGFVFQDFNLLDTFSVKDNILLPLVLRGMKYNEMTAGKTSVFISHRLASTRFCDRILFLQDGIIAEEGTHEDLLALGGEYAKLFEVQSRYYQEGREF